MASFPMSWQEMSNEQCCLHILSFLAKHIYLVLQLKLAHLKIRMHEFGIID